MTINTLTDLFTPEELSTYQQHPFPYNLPLLKTALDKKLREDPTYEVFIPLYYRKQDKRVKDDNALKEIKLHYLLISNKGKILSCNNPEKEYREIPTSVHPGGYTNAFIAVQGKNNSVALHRALGCTFIPVSEELLEQGYHPKDLEVNHIDGDKQNWDLDNLEWCTTKQNINHAVETGLMASGKEHQDTKPVKGKVIRGNHIGYEFVLFGGSNLEEYGFDQAAVSNVANGNLKSHGNCEWCFATEEDIQNLPHTIPEEITKDLKDVSPWIKYRFIGTNLKTGETIVIHSPAEAKEKGFNINGIRNNLCGISRSSGGYSWTQELLTP